MKRLTSLFLVACGVLSLPFVASAHEAYVLTTSEWHSGLAAAWVNPFTALHDKTNLLITLTVVVATLVALIVAFFIRHSAWGRKADTRLVRWQDYGAVAVRISLAVSLFYSAYTNVILGPELPLSAVPWGALVRIGLYLASALFLFGFLTEVASVITLVAFGFAIHAFGWYLVTYANYLGETLLLLWLGASRFSLDAWLFQSNTRFAKWRDYGPTLLRISYGIALGYAAVNIKLLHPMLTIDVVKDYHLTQFHWLFPSDPLLITLGAGLTELAISILVILGLQLRVTLLVTLFYITLSLFYFREAVWPHLMLYGIAINLIFNGGGALTIDRWVDSVWPLKQKKHKSHVAAQR